eukprot:jgi/Mesvir1/1498/Mv14481-RA.1
MANVAKTLYGNPSSSHDVGKMAREIVEKSRRDILRNLGVPKSKLIFTSGSTESMNLLLNGVMEKHDYRGVVLTSTIEHPAGVKPLEHMQSSHADMKVVKIPVDKEGFLRLDKLRESVKKYKGRIKLASFIYANNEIGTIQDLCKIRRVIGTSVHFHSDTTQAAGKFPITGQECLDSFTLSGHKIHGIKGIGGLIIKNSTNCLTPHTFGGSQEHGVRPGTESPPLIASLASAMDINRKSRKQIVSALSQNRLKFREELEKLGGVFNGPENLSKSLPNLISVAFPGARAKILSARLSKEGVCVSVGSACHLQKRSEVLKAIGLDKKLENGTIRIGMSHFTTGDDLKALVKAITKAL